MSRNTATAPWRPPAVSSSGRELTLRCSAVGWSGSGWRTTTFTSLVASPARARAIDMPGSSSVRALAAAGVPSRRSAGRLNSVSCPV
jgi:hypothetical protein